MKFIKQFDHLKLLKLGLAISIFAIGYLITMFYFQMVSIKDFKNKTIIYNKAVVSILHLELEFERNNYFIQSQALNQIIDIKPTKLNDHKYVINFFHEVDQLSKIDPIAQKHNSEIKTLIKDYEITKSQLLNNNKIYNINKYNTLTYKLSAEIENYISYLELKIKEYNIHYESLINSSKTSSFLIAIFSLVIFILSYVKMNGDLYELRKINDEILFNNQILNNAEMVAGFGSWKINTVTKTFLLSDNFYRLLGCEPKSFVPSLSTILEFIHPEDKERVKKLHEESFINKNSTTILYRYLFPDGTIKHMVSVGKFLMNSKGDLVKIGVNQDITELMKKTTELEEKNTKLVAINSELDSFNNIVSHDLQEPLRKIQMFISRIENKDFLESSSEATISYFEKIKFAATRMQNLMTDLVEYTRTVKSDRIVENVDLNSIFEEIKEEFAFTIENKQADILIDNFPIIKGIRFQIQQLFINLISNSLKYVQPNVKPIIQIQLETFNKEIVDNNTISGADYYKITVRDNGIGFDNEYSSKIFMLFKRLPTTETYAGTGLGLAICKKIIDNHNAFIVAKGKFNQGSVFSIYFPRT